MSRYKSCAFAWACLLLAAGGAPAQPGWKPDRPVEIIVTCQPGCGPDIAARTIQKIWQKTTESPKWKKDLETPRNSDDVTK